MRRLHLSSQASQFLGIRSARLLLAAWLACVMGGCPPAEEDAGCSDDGVCGPGLVCDRATGRCVDAPDVEELPDHGAYTSIAVSEEGAVWVATQVDGELPALGVGRVERGEAIELDLIVEGPGMGEGTSIAIDSVTGQPAAAFHDAGTGRLLFSRRVEETWSLETIDGEAGDAFVGAHPSLAFDDAGRAWVAYHDATAGSLRVASSDGGSWTVDVADEPPPSAGRRGLYGSLVVVHGDPLVAHYDEGNGDLRVSRRDARGWTSTVLDGSDPISGADTGDVGRFVSAAIDPYGNAALAFYDATHGVLRYAWSDRGVLESEVVDQGDAVAAESGPRPSSLVGQYASLAFGQGGEPRIVYLDGTSLELVLSVRSGGAWQRRVIGSSPLSGLWAAQGIDPEGHSVVGHCRVSPSAARGARQRLEVLWP